MTWSTLSGPIGGAALPAWWFTGIQSSSQTRPERVVVVDVVQLRNAATHTAFPAAAPRRCSPFA